MNPESYNGVQVTETRARADPRVEIAGSVRNDLVYTRKH